MNVSLPITNCDGCGACCRTMGHPRYFWDQSQGVNVDPHWIKLPKKLMSELDSYLAELPDETADLGKPCIWFDEESLTCRHHDHRPKVCRDLEIGSEACIRSRRQFGL